jgi:hypothetical protein
MESKVHIIKPFLLMILRSLLSVMSLTAICNLMVTLLVQFFVSRMQWKSLSLGRILFTISLEGALLSLKLDGCGCS